MTSGAIGFSPSNLHGHSINCLEIDVADLMFAWETLRASSKCKTALERKEKYIIIVWNSGEEELLNSQWKIYSNPHLAVHLMEGRRSGE